MIKKIILIALVAASTGCTAQQWRDGLKGGAIGLAANQRQYQYNQQQHNNFVQQQNYNTLVHQHNQMSEDIRLHNEAIRNQR